MAISKQFRKANTKGGTTMTYAIGPDVWTSRNGIDGMANRLHASHASRTAEPRASRADAASDFADRVVRASVACHGVLLVGEGSTSLTSGSATPARAAGSKHGNASGTGITAMISKVFSSLGAFLNAPLTA